MSLAAMIAYIKKLVLLLRMWLSFAGREKFGLVIFFLKRQLNRNLADIIA